jgi:murein DD-endopeptidase MepM/ murein hydrolase activator NlpD
VPKDHHSPAARLRPVGLLAALVAGASGAAQTASDPSPQQPAAAAPAALPLFRKPFAGEHPLLNLFDHDLPLRAADTNRRAVDWRGRRSRANRAQDGHAGYDFAMPVGTPIFAVAAGQVAVAGSEAPHPCHLRAGAASALWVKLVHRLPAAAGGELIVTNYVHLSRIDVRAGEQVEAGQQLGLSGNTGCSTIPHLHFAAGRQFYTSDGARGGTYFDPSGWAGRYPDPWARHPRGAQSTRMWLPGQAPAGL